MLDKKKAAEQKSRYALHVSLLMVHRGLTKPEASWQAWVDGPRGLDKLLSKLTETGEG